MSYFPNGKAALCTIVLKPQTQNKNPPAFRRKGHVTKVRLFTKRLELLPTGFVQDVLRNTNVVRDVRKFDGVRTEDAQLCD